MSQPSLEIRNVNKAFGEDRAPFRWCQYLNRVLAWPACDFRSFKYWLQVFGFTFWWLSKLVLPKRWTEGTNKNRVLHEISLKILRGQVVALVGPSGCGKSTLLKAVCGTHPQDSGEILAGGNQINKPSRDIGIVYQDYDLYDSMTARQNVAIGLNWDEWTSLGRIFYFWRYWKKRKEYLRRADELLEKVGLGSQKNQYPPQLSGGQRQRVAICQAIIMEPKILLLDEPFGALDEATRGELQLMLLHLYQENVEARKAGQPSPYTILIVTHELNEAFYVSDRVIGLSQFHEGNSDKDGRFINYVGATIVYDEPAPVFHPNDPKEFASFLEQKEKVREFVMDKTTLQDHKDFITYWDDHEKLTYQRNK